MRWFKHMADASDDAFIEGLEQRFGLDGYARWWKMLEVIARAMDKNRDDPTASHPIEKWCLFMSAKRKILLSFLEYCENQTRIKTQSSDNILIITCPKLLKMRDEYSRKSGHTPDSCPDNVAPETETEKKEESVEPSENKPYLHNTYIPENFVFLWKAFPGNKGSKFKAGESYAKIIKTGIAHETIMTGVAKMAEYHRVMLTEPQHIPHAVTWLNQRRWDDEYQPQQPKGQSNDTSGNNQSKWLGKRTEIKQQQIQRDSRLLNPFGNQPEKLR